MGPATDTPQVHGKPHMAELSTPWSRAMRLGAPILNAPMGGVAGGRLASAVSEAGGLGMIGVGSAGSVELLEREVANPQSAGLPFGIGLLDWALALEPQLLDAAIAASPVLISVSFGDTWRWAERVREAGIVTAAQVSCVETARSAADAGIDVLVARGAEGGGHGEPAVGTLPLSKAFSRRLRSRCSPPEVSRPHEDSPRSWLLVPRGLGWVPRLLPALSRWRLTQIAPSSLRRRTPIP
jgi:nitronate monooxygenase